MVPGLRAGGIPEPKRAAGLGIRRLAAGLRTQGSSFGCSGAHAGLQDKLVDCQSEALSVRRSKL